MSHELLRDPRFFLTLLQFDQDLSAQTQAGGCSHCGGRLHRADYPRKPRGTPPQTLGPEYQTRFSFCCSQDGCRRRRTPASVRFLGRHVYLAAVVVLVSAMRHGVTAQRLESLRAWFGMSARTLARWQRFWAEIFVQSPVWKALQGRMIPVVEEQRLPASWLERIADVSQSECVLRVLMGLLPLTTRTAGNGACRTRVA